MLYVCVYLFKNTLFANASPSVNVLGLYFKISSIKRFIFHFTRYPARKAKIKPINPWHFFYAVLFTVAENNPKRNLIITSSATTIWVISSLLSLLLSGFLIKRIYFFLFDVKNGIKRYFVVVSPLWESIRYNYISRYGVMNFFHCLGLLIFSLTRYGLFEKVGRRWIRKKRSQNRIKPAKKTKVVWYPSKLSFLCFSSQKVPGVFRTAIYLTRENIFNGYYS